MVPADARPSELVRALSRRPSLALEERHHGGAITPNPASSRSGAPSRRKARMPAASVVWPTVHVGQGGTERGDEAGGPAEAPEQLLVGVGTWRSSAVSSGPSPQTVAAETSRLGSSTACRANCDAPALLRIGSVVLFPLHARRKVCSPCRVVPSSLSSDGGTIRKQVRTASNAALLVACQARSCSASCTHSSSAQPCMAPSGEASALTHASSTLPLVLLSLRRGLSFFRQVSGKDVRHRPHQQTQDFATSLCPRKGKPSSVFGPAWRTSRERCREGPHQRLNPAAVAPVNERSPACTPMATGEFEIGEKPATGEELDRQSDREAP